MSLSSETTVITGGGQANKTGSTLERFVRRLLEDNGYTVFPNHKAQLFQNRLSVGGSNCL